MFYLKAGRCSINKEGKFMDALITVSEEIIEKIKKGEKKVEFRRLWTKKKINSIYFCQKSSKGFVSIKTTLENVIVLDKFEAWEYYQIMSGVDEAMYFKYLEGREKVFCLILGKAKSLVNTNIKDFGFLTAPQNYYILR